MFLCFKSYPRRFKYCFYHLHDIIMKESFFGKLPWLLKYLLKYFYYLVNDLMLLPLNPKSSVKMNSKKSTFPKFQPDFQHTLRILSTLWNSYWQLLPEGPYNGCSSNISGAAFTSIFIATMKYLDISDKEISWRCGCQ